MHKSGNYIPSSIRMLSVEMSGLERTVRVCGVPSDYTGGCIKVQILTVYFLIW